MHAIFIRFCFLLTVIRALWQQKESVRERQQLNRVVKEMEYWCICVKVVTKYRCYRAFDFHLVKRTTADVMLTRSEIKPITNWRKYELRSASQHITNFAEHIHLFWDHDAAHRSFDNMPSNMQYNNSSTALHFSMFFFFSFFYSKAI